MKKRRTLLLGIITLFFANCENNDSIQDLQAEKLIQKEIPIAVSETYYLQNESNKTNKSNMPTSVNTDWKTITHEDLNNLGMFSVENFAKDRFVSLMPFKDRPVNVSVNDVKLGSGTNPNGGQNWSAELRLEGTGTYEASLSYTNWSPVPGFSARVETNYTNATKDLGGFVLFNKIETTTTNWNVSSTAGIKIGAKIGIPLVTEGSVEVSLGVTAGGGGSKSTTFSENYRTPNINVAKGKSVRFVLEQRWRPIKDNWKFPVKFRGSVGADYGKRVNDHYFWSLPATSYFSEFQNGNLFYTVNLTEKSALETRVAAYHL